MEMLKDIVKAQHTLENDVRDSKVFLSIYYLFTDFDQGVYLHTKVKRPLQMISVNLNQSYQQVKTVIEVLRLPGVMLVMLCFTILLRKQKHWLSMTEIMATCLVSKQNL